MDAVKEQNKPDTDLNNTSNFIEKPSPSWERAIQWFRRMHEDSEHEPSSLRFNLTVVTFFGLTHAFVYPQYSMYSLALVGVAFGAKGWQASNGG